MILRVWIHVACVCVCSLLEKVDGDEGREGWGLMRIWRYKLLSWYHVTCEICTHFSHWPLWPSSPPLHHHDNKWWVYPAVLSFPQSLSLSLVESAEECNLDLMTLLKDYCVCMQQEISAKSVVCTCWHALSMWIIMSSCAKWEYTEVTTMLTHRIAL